MYFGMKTVTAMRPDGSLRANGLDLLALCARLALGASFLTAVADRLGQYGPAGTAGVAWGDMQHFQAYAARLNPWFPPSVIPPLSWFVTVTETILGLSLIAGFQIRLVSMLSGVLLLTFAIGMTAGTGVRSALYASVFSASACAFLLSQREPDRLSLDSLLRRRGAAAIDAPPRKAIHYTAAAWALVFAAPHTWWALGAGLVADGSSDLVWWPIFLAGGLLFGAVAFSTSSEASRTARGTTRES